MKDIDRPRSIFEDIRIILRQPFILGLKSPEFALMASTLMSRATTFSPKPFSLKFDTLEIEEKYRKIYPINEILTDNLKSQFKNFIESCIPNVLKTLVLEKGPFLRPVSASEKNLRFAVRIRLFCDEKNYALPPHKDSSNTIFSFIYALDSESECTKIYELVEVHDVTEVLLIHKDPVQLLSYFLKSRGTSKNITLSGGQFGALCAYTENHTCYALRIDQEKLTAKIDEFKEFSFFPDKDELYAIQNVDSPILINAGYEQESEKFFHGVPPTLTPMRHRIIIDLLVGLTSEMFLYSDGLNTDNYAYWLLYGESSSRNLESILAGDF